METILWRLRVPESKRNEFEALARQLVSDVRTHEPGQVFEYRRTQDGSGTYVLFMSFTDREAFERYANAEYHQAVAPGIMACIDGEPQSERLDPF